VCVGRGTVVLALVVASSAEQALEQIAARED
jgi:hypothetical protein